MKRLLLISIHLITLFLFSAIVMHSTDASVYASTGFKSYTKWVVLNDTGDIHSEPNLNSPILLKAPDPSSFPLINRSGKWIELQLGSNQKGWIEEGKVEIKNTSEELQTVSIKKDTTMYDGPDQTFHSSAAVQSDSPYYPLEIGGDWVHILSVKSGQLGWVPGDSILWGGTSSDLLPNSPPAIPASVPQTDQPLKGKTIVVDPGHGGKDTGAIGKKKPVYERDVNLAVADVLVNKLKAAGAQVILTRNSNDQFVSLADRVKIATKNKADLFISIHQNQYPTDPSVNGTITYYYNTDKSKTLAQMIEQQAVSSLNEKDSQNEITQDNFYVISHNTRPAVLVEGCFLSNVMDLNNSILPTYQENLSTGIYHGILNYFGLSSVDEKQNYF